VLDHVNAVRPRKGGSAAGQRGAAPCQRADCQHQQGDAWDEGQLNGG
jgi:hypothetical protein